MTSRILVRGGRVVDPSRSGSESDRVADLLLDGGRIVAVGEALASDGATVVDARGLVVAPGFVDLHVHLREPGHEYKEDLGSGGRAAAAGGFTTVCCMPNTTPVNDCRAVTELIVRRAREASPVKVRPVGAISKGLKGETLAEMGEMKDAGIVAVSDDGMPVMHGDLMRRALEYARTFDLCVVQHAEDKHLSAGGVMHEGAASARAGLPGQPGAAESVMVARDLELVALTGARYHVAHISTAASVELVRAAKKRGLPVTCEVTPHHLTLTDEACTGYDTRTKCAPPLRTEADREALKIGLADGTIDCIATDHAPHGTAEKELEFDHAAFGMTGLETALPLGLRLVDEKILTLHQLVDLLTHRPSRVFGLSSGTLAEGAAGDVTIFDPTAAWTYDTKQGRSKSRNSPFDGWALRGAVRYTIVDGVLVHGGSA